MHWLQALDTRLFDFINRSLANPFFDWLMPILSGSNGTKNAFIVLAGAVGVALLCFGNRRLQLCVLLTRNGARFCASAITIWPRRWTPARPFAGNPATIPGSASSAGNVGCD
jgi:hypothetical protein